MAEIKGLNPHDYPPEVIRQLFKRYQKYEISAIESDPGIVDLQKLDLGDLPDSITLAGTMLGSDLRAAFEHFTMMERPEQPDSNIKDVPVFTLPSVSGLHVIPSLFPPFVQLHLLSRLFHRDLSNPNHRTNIHLHYDVTYPSETNNIRHSSACGSHDDTMASFFRDDPARKLSPKEPGVHKSISIRSFLDQRLRWLTLGGQYNWTAKEYPATQSPSFPEDIGRLLRAIFPETEGQAAVVNLYSAGDTMGVHRDVSEECDAGLISVSLGCEGLFLIGHDREDGCEIIRLRSGDTLYMTGKSRFAWHAVPKVLPSTCPSWLRDWPVAFAGLPEGHLADPVSRDWQGWISRKRINLNVRQMTSRER
ncbi:hypothetical protein Egran_05466 [Elaphomyces granulatus]|uniref:mRNA N(6)-methyladenine demethylase n=1 Tax=Elaphomyces granulatus TaxID=519963 RepID=A0A232LSH3_9EURO|nr:hypothetical protein Egran_05466 [Elaphomyces granulatus]